MVYNTARFEAYIRSQSNLMCAARFMYSKRNFIEHTLPYVVVYNSVNYKLSTTIVDGFNGKPYKRWINSIYGKQAATPQFMEFETIEELKATEKSIREMAIKDAANIDEGRLEGTYYNFISLDYVNEKILTMYVPDNIPYAPEQKYLLHYKHLIIPDIYFNDDYKEIRPLMLKDYFFRKKDEVPNSYSWDYGEYEGWLQYRWGDGKNALDYQAPKINKVEKKIVEETEQLSETELIADEFEAKCIKENEKDFMAKQSW